MRKGACVSSPEAGTQPAVLDDISGSWERALLWGRRFALGTTRHPDTAWAVFSGTHLTPASPPVAAPCSGSRAFGGTCPIPNGAFPSLPWDTSHTQPPGQRGLGAAVPHPPLRQGTPRGLSSPAGAEAPHARGQPFPPVPVVPPPPPRGLLLPRRRGFLASLLALEPIWGGEAQPEFPQPAGSLRGRVSASRALPLIAGLPRGSAASAARRRPASPPGTRRRRRRVSPSCRLSVLRTSGLSPCSPVSLPLLPPG